MCLFKHLSSILCFHMVYTKYFFHESHDISTESLILSMTFSNIFFSHLILARIDYLLRVTFTRWIQNEENLRLHLKRANRPLLVVHHAWLLGTAVGQWRIDGVLVVVSAQSRWWLWLKRDLAPCCKKIQLVTPDFNQSSCKNSKIAIRCWTTIDRRMLDPTKKDTSHPRAKEEPQKDGRRGKIMLRPKLYTCQRCLEGSD